MNRNFFIEVNSQQKNHDGERICGDVFLYRYIKEENRVIAVLSDGMGLGEFFVEMNAKARAIRHRD